MTTYVRSIAGAVFLFVSLLLLIWGFTGGIDIGPIVGGILFALIGLVLLVPGVFVRN